MARCNIPTRIFTLYTINVENKRSRGIPLVEIDGRVMIKKIKNNKRVTIVCVLLRGRRVSPLHIGIIHYVWLVVPLLFVRTSSIPAAILTRILRYLLLDKTLDPFVRGFGVVLPPSVQSTAAARRISGFQTNVDKRSALASADTLSRAHYTQSVLRVPSVHDSVCTYTRVYTPPTQGVCPLEYTDFKRRGVGIHIVPAVWSYPNLL